MNKYMVVCTFRPGTSTDDISAMAPAEMAEARLLREEGHLTGVHVSTNRDKVFLEVLANDLDGAGTIVRRLPMSVWWDLESYQIANPL